MPDKEQTKSENQEPESQEQEQEEKGDGYEDRVMNAIMSTTEEEPEETS